MTQEKQDRRVQRTRQLLNEALMALIVEKGYEAITVQDILDRANLGRSTFYAHYRDKDDLLLSGFEWLRRLFEEQSQRVETGTHGPRGESSDPILAFFQHAAEHHDLYKALVGKKGGEMVQAWLHQYVGDTVRSHLQARSRGARYAIPLDVVVHFAASSFLSLATWWLEHDMPYTAEQMNAIFQQLVMPGIELAMKSKE